MPAPPSMFDSPHPADHLPADGYIQPNLGHGLRIWWAFFWPTSLAAAGLTVLVNLFVKNFYETIRLLAAVAGPILKYDAYIFTYLVALFVMAHILRKNFRHFRIGLLSNHGGQGVEPLPPTLRRTVRVWWTYSWRTLVYRIVASFLVSFPLGWTIGFLKAHQARPGVHYPHERHRRHAHRRCRRPFRHIQQHPRRRHIRFPCGAFAARPVNQHSTC
jgi:hypothetical protein